MRDGILKLFIVSMLFVSMEGVADSVDELSFHQTHHEHVDNSGEQWFPDSDGDDHKGDACEHYCHAHVVGLTTQVMVANAPHFQYYVAAPPAHTVTHNVAPPTPPPNL